MKTTKAMREGVSVVCVLSIGAALAAACGSSMQPHPESPAEASSESASSSNEKKLDCAFIKSPDNCWRMLAGSIGACLGGRIHNTGKLSDDRTVCPLEDEVMVKLGQPCDPDAECDVRDVFMGRAGKKCFEFHATEIKPPTEMGRGAGTIEVTSADGTVRIEWDETTKTLTCPKGDVYKGSGDWKKELKDCADESGYQGIPTYAFTKVATAMDGKKKKPGTGTVSFELSSLETLFDCAK